MKAAVAQYYPADSVLHRLDPRAKIVAVGVLAVALFMGRSFAPLAVYGVVCLAGIVLSRVPPAWYWRALRPVLWLVVLTFVMQVLFTPGPALVHLGPVRVSEAGLEMAVYLSLRLAILVVTSTLLTLTTAPIPLTDGLAWLGRPLRVVRVPTEELAVMVTIALRFIPTLVQETEIIMRAQRARGARIGHGSPVARAKALVPVLVPLFIQSFRRADEIALAMDARCFVPGARRTRLHPLRAGAGDAVLLAVVAVVVVLASVV